MDSLLESKKILFMFCVWPSQNIFSPLPKKRRLLLDVASCAVEYLDLSFEASRVCVGVCVCVCFQRRCFLLDMADCGRGPYC